MLKGEAKTRYQRDERTGRRVFNAQALKALGVEPARGPRSAIPAQRRSHPIRTRRLIATNA